MKNRFFKTCFLLFISFFLVPQTGYAKLHAKLEDDKVSVTVSAIGDCTLGIDSKQASLRNFNKEFQAHQSYDYFFKKVAVFLKKVDLTFANLEGTFTQRTSRADKTFAFKGNPKYVKILKSGSVETVNLANNHSMDYGKGSYNDTVKTLSDAGIPYFNGNKIVIQKIKGIRVGLIGIKTMASMNRETELKNAIKKCKKKGANLIIVSFHWGIERENLPNSLQKKHAHLAIQSGADLVLGHHPHVLQSIEKYKGKYIVYSLGNFCFGGNTNPSDKDTMIFQQTFTFQKGKLKKDHAVKIIPCSLSSVKNRNNYQPTPLNGKEKQRVIKKVNQFSKSFGLTFDQKGRPNK